MSPLGLLVVALVIVIGGVLVLRLHPFVVLITAAFAVALLVPRLPGGESSAGEIVAQGFGKTTLDVGIVIALASMLGACLAAAGRAADRRIDPAGHGRAKHAPRPAARRLRARNSNVRRDRLLFIAAAGAIDRSGSRGSAAGTASTDHAHANAAIAPRASPDFSAPARCVASGVCMPSV